MTTRRADRRALIAVLVGVVLAGGAGVVLHAQAAVAPPQPAAKEAPRGVPVTLDGETLFYVTRGLGPFTAEERARSAEQRLLLIAEDPFFSSALFRIVPKADQAEVYYRDHLVGIVGREDVAQGGGTLEEAAAVLLQTVEDAVTRYRERRQPMAWTRAVVVVGVATVVVVLLVVGLRRARRQLASFIMSRRRAEAAPEAASGLAAAFDRTIPVQLKALALLYYSALVAVLALYAGTVSTAVPMTKGYALAAIDYVLEPIRTLWQGFLASVGNLVFIAVVAALAYYLVKGLRWLLSEAAVGHIVVPGVAPDWAMLLFKVLRLGVVAIAAVLIYPYIPGSDTAAFKGLGLFAGALFTLGASGMAGNIIGGLALTFAGTLHVGDRVKIGEVVGDVVETTLILTRVRSIRNEIITIPNATLLSNHVVNYSTEARSKGLALVTEVTIGYDAPWRRVHELLVDAARRTPRILPDPAPYVVQRSLNDYHVSYQIWAFTDDANAMVVTYGLLHQNVQDAFNEGGVEILSPRYDSLRDGNRTTIPASYRPADYEAPSYRVRVSDSSDHRAGGA